MRRRPIAQNPALDLFGEVPVLESEIVDWVAAVAPRWLAPPRSYASYVRTYAVAEKIRAAKLAGTYDAIIAQRRPSYHARLALAAIV